MRISRRYGPSRARSGSWTLLTGHAHVLVEIARNTQARIGDIAAAVGLTERTVQAVIADLEAAGYLTRSRSGRRTVYTIHPDRPFRHPAQDGHCIGPFLELLAAPSDRADDAAPATPRAAGGNTACDTSRNPPAGP
jgi:DNA-binding transcriptional ArsR family regulator